LEESFDLRSELTPGFAVYLEQLRWGGVGMYAIQVSIADRQRVKSYFHDNLMDQSSPTAVSGTGSPPATLTTYPASGTTQRAPA
jgi:hypothetical protein